MTGLSFCCGKKRYATERTARRALRFIDSVAVGRHPVRVYQCPRGWWHLTSQPTYGGTPR
ncbi:hypothetical protein [Actinomadura gamaensis]|uniref:Uncharacterized protein n=1 Tax=Actinomadura gamaensis TaxID=1763541 RepID=A0ABV9UC18_9ACTN